MGVLKNLQTMDTRNTSMSCLGNDESTNTGSDGSSADEKVYLQCSDDQLLPCFLDFSTVTIPRTDNSYMACPVILRRPLQEAIQVCSGTGPMQLSSQAENLADLTATEQTWSVDPQYYQHRHCKCLEVRAVLPASPSLSHACFP